MLAAGTGAVLAAIGGVARDWRGADEAIDSGILLEMGGGAEKTV